MKLIRFTNSDAAPPVEIGIDPLAVVGVAGGGDGCVILLQGGHQVRVDGAWHAVKTKIEAAHEAMEVPQLFPPQRDEGVGLTLQDIADISDPNFDDEGPSAGVEMLELHDGPAEA